MLPKGWALRMHTTRFLNRQVEVIMDRSLVSKHPKHGFIYPINYGFTPHTRSPDGEPEADRAEK
jgi:inorganic pyrophosphatase